jgi:hypothetical protein
LRGIDDEIWESRVRAKEVGGYRTSNEVVYTCATAWPCFGDHDVNLVWLAAAVVKLLPSAGSIYQQT